MERLLFLGFSMVDWLNRFHEILGSLSLSIDFPLDILLQDAQLVHVARHLHEMQVQRIARTILGQSDREKAALRQHEQQGD